MMQHLKLNPHLLAVPANIGGKPTEQVEAEYGVTDAVELGSNENSFGPSPRAVAAFKDALKNAHRYPGVADKRLRRKLAAHFNARDAASFTERNFLTGNGLTDVIRMLIQAFVFDGGETITCTPTFPMYWILTQEYGGKSIQVPHTNYRHDLPAMADAITERTRIVFICNPNNPTGTLVTRDEIAAFMARVPPSVVVVIDEAYSDFVDAADYSNALDYAQQGHNPVIVLRTFSKSYGLAGLRVGYAIGTPAMIEYLAHAQIVFNTGDPTLYAAMAALDDHAYLAHARALIATEKQFLYDGLARLDLQYVPTQANFILLIDLPRDVKTINEGLLRRGVIVRPMGGFGMPDAIRVTIGTHEQNEKMLDAMKDVLKQ